ncbi:MAG: Wzt carbohydrate-binding domain-containing protein, partial [Opitutaceae bacterium]|nr:Wzt carbohydrate-binding domain-containing protein [Opitutaceae bacterium]
CLGKMGEVSKAGRTVLFVSHNMAATRALCTTAIWMDQGAVKEIGRVAPVADHYLARLHANPSLDTALGDRPRAQHFGSKLKLTHVRLNQGRGLWHGQPLEVEFHFECPSAVEEVSFGIGFCNRDGPPVLCLDSDIPGKRWSIAAGQSGWVLLKLPSLHLEPHFYSLYVGARSGNAHILDYLPQVGDVLVTPSEATPAMIAGQESGRGGVRQPSEASLTLDLSQPRAGQTRPPFPSSPVRA